MRRRRGAGANPRCSLRQRDAAPNPRGSLRLRSALSLSRKCIIADIRPTRPLRCAYGRLHWTSRAVVPLLSQLSSSADRERRHCAACVILLNKKHRHDFSFVRNRACFIQCTFNRGLELLLKRTALVRSAGYEALTVKYCVAVSVLLSLTVTRTCHVPDDGKLTLQVEAVVLLLTAVQVPLPIFILSIL